MFLFGFLFMKEVQTDVKTFFKKRKKRVNSCSQRISGIRKLSWKVENICYHKIKFNAGNYILKF